MIPLLALGIFPRSPATAVLLSALTIHGVQPGPLLLTDHPECLGRSPACISQCDPADPHLAGRDLVESAAHSYAWLVPMILIISTSASTA